MALRALISLARRRLFWNELLAEGVRAVSIGLGALILLLVAGTSMLRWEWLVPVPLTAAIWGFYRAWRRRPSRYRTACTIDQRLAFSDALSTAYHFSQPDHVPVAEELRQLQFEQAERLAADADARSAVPWVMPRSTYVLVALVAVASGLFALRFALSRRLDLRPPLARMIERELGIDNPPRQLASGGGPNRGAPAEPEPPSDVDPGSDQADGAAQEANIDDEIAQALGNHPDSKPGDSEREQGSARTGNTKGGENEKGTSDQSSAAPNESADANQKNNRKGDERQRRDAKEDSGGDGESSSLISKVKDAFENLLSKMKPQQGNPGSQEQSSRDQAGQRDGKQNAAQPRSAQSGQSSSDPRGDSGDSQTAEKSENAPDPAGKGTGKSEAQASKQPGSGVGSQEGDKSIKQAEQLAAMGKITEIIGKRSANLTGEATVEVKSTTQQLHTQYARNSAQHAQTGSSISRDDVPLALQAYVAQYFEQVRKQPAPAAEKKQ
jgi:hypothetical protein